jgi:hypothetical protein
MAELRKRGLITAVICSTPFEKLGRAQAKVLGVPDLPLVMIQHPLGGLAIEDVRARADQATPVVIDLLRDWLK